MLEFSETGLTTQNQSYLREIQSWARRNGSLKSKFYLVFCWWQKEKGVIMSLQSKIENSSGSPNSLYLQQLLTKCQSLIRFKDVSLQKEASQTNEREREREYIHKIYLLKQVYIKVHRNQRMGQLSPPRTQVTKKQWPRQDVKRSCGRILNIIS